MVMFALAGIPGVARAEPRKCDLALTVTPPTIPEGSRIARVIIPAGLSDIQLRASSGTVSEPAGLDSGSLVAEFTAAAKSPPVALVAAVSWSACGFSIVRSAAAASVPAGGAPVTLVVVEPPVARADLDVEVLVYVFAVDGRGAPRRGKAPAFRPSVGSVADVQPLAPGAWRGRWRIPPGEAGAVVVKAAFGTEAPGSASLARTPGLPAAIEITQDPVSGAGPSATPTAVLARIRDSAGNLTDGPLELESDVAQMGAPVRLERGVFRAPLVVPPGTQDKTLLIMARADRAIATATFSIAPSVAAAVRVTPPGPVRVDGATQAQLVVLEVAVVDVSGYPVNDVPVGSGGRGEFREAYPVGPGQWALPYRPPGISEDTAERVVVKAGAASTTVDLKLVARRVSVSLGAKAGVSIGGGSVGPAVGVEAGVWTRFGQTQLGLVLDVTWWMRSTTSTATVGGVDSTYKATQNYLPFLLSVAWRTPLADRWMLWATLGGGGGVVSNSSQVGVQPKVSESGFAPAASGSLSAGPRLGPGSLFLEVRATWIGDPKLSTLSGSSTTFLGLVGYRFDVG
jgi:hypothetical protein